MEPKFQSSFIPKGPISTSGIANFTPQKKRSAFGIVAIIIFVISILLAAGAFGYNEYLLYHIGALGANLDAAKASLMPDEITSITHADARLSATRAILAQHVAVSELFDYLEQSTEKNVALSQLAYQTGQQTPTITFTGMSTSYATLKLESDTLNAATFLKNQSFGNLSLDAKGNINFTFTAAVDPAVFLYKNKFTATSTVQGVSVVATSSTTLPALTVATTTSTTTAKTLTTQKTSTTTALKTATSTKTN